MTLEGRKRIVERAKSLSDEELENEYYAAVFDSLGSEIEAMYEFGYDIADIIAQEKYERDLCTKADILEAVCRERGIKLWE